MRIAVLSWSRRRSEGGTGEYVATVMRALQAAGHALALVSEVDSPPHREVIRADVVGDWCAETLGSDAVVARLCQWQPDVLYSHGLLDPALEARLLEMAPAAFFAHGFYGTCISGAKSFKAPVPRPCDRRFGWPCFLHYCPHRCGGWSPITMVRDYRRQAARLRLLRRYAAIITHSRSMESEYVKHGIPEYRVHRVPWCVSERDSELARRGGSAESRAAQRDDRPHLVFCGRMTPLKGGQLLLRALPAIRGRLGRDLRVTFAGDGPQRTAWERQAASLSVRHRGLEITFTGWLSPDRRDALFEESDLLIVPSVWPEPFGQVGIEAGRRGVPAAAFAVGGIPDWLENGVNGFLAPSDPPTPHGLAEAVVECLRDPGTLQYLRRGAAELAGRWSVVAHLARLEPILASIAQRTPQRPSPST